MSASLRRIWGLVYRHLALYRRSWPRLLELAYWPVLQMCIWGFTSAYLMTRQGFGWQAAGALIGGVLLWEVALRSTLGVALSFLEEMWSRNLGHILVSPIRPVEMVAAFIAMGLLRTFAGVVPAAVLAWLLYAFNILTFGPLLVVFFANLMVMGWWVALAVVSLILRHGQGAEALAWSTMFGLTPFAAVYYPVDVLPSVLKAVALALPASHVFEGMRAAMAGVARWDHLAAAGALNVVWMAAAAWLFASQLRAARIKGALVSIGE